MPRVGRAEDGGTGDKLGGNSKSRAENWVERAQKKPEAKETAQKRKEQTNGKRVALGRRSFEPDPNRSAERKQRRRRGIKCRTSNFVKFKYTWEGG